MEVNWIFYLFDSCYYNSADRIGQLKNNFLQEILNISNIIRLEVDQMYCSQCGEKIEDDVKFCTNCGNCLNAEIGEAIEKAVPAGKPMSKPMPTGKSASIMKKMFSFEGRLSRLEYFKLSLFLTVPLLFGLLMGSVFLFNGEIVGCLITIFLILPPVLVSGMALNVQRLHDLSKSGILALLLLVIPIGSFLSFYLLFAKGTEGSNIYGEDPMDC